MCVAFGVAFGLAKPDQVVREDGTSIAVFHQLSWNYGKEGNYSHLRLQHQLTPLSILVDVIVPLYAEGRLVYTGDVLSQSENSATQRKVQDLDDLEEA